MGRVFLGRSAGGRPVAVKVIRADLGADPEFRERFRREVAAAQKVNGLYTALVVDADLDGPTPWLATAYVAGPSLADAVSRHGPLPVTAVRVLAAGLAEGPAIHAAGLVHRDLKPSNVLLADDGPRGHRLRDLARGRGERADSYRPGHRLARIHVAGAGRRPGGRDAQRRLQPRGGPDVRGHGPGTVRDGAHGRACLPHRARPARRRRRPGPAQAAGRALPGPGSPAAAHRRRRPGRGGRPRPRRRLAARIGDRRPCPADRFRADRFGAGQFRGGRFRAATHRVGDTISLPGSPSSIAASPDGRFLAIGNHSGDVYQAIKTDGHFTIGRLPRSSQSRYFPPVVSTTFSADGSMLAAGFAGGGFCLWRTSTGLVERILVVRTADGSSTSAFSPDGLTLAGTGTNGAIGLWTAGTGKLARNLSAQASGSGASLAFSPDGKTLIDTGDNGHIYLWSTATAKVTRTFADPGTKGASAGALTRDGKTLAVADDNGHLYLWSMTSGKIIGTLAYQLPANGTAALAFSPDGRTLAAAGDQGQIQLCTIR